MKLFVVVPFRNAPRELAASLASLRAQTEPFEAVVIDDASTDPGCAEVLAAAVDPRLTIVRHDANTGPAGARATGLAWVDGRAASDDVVVLLDGDDELVDAGVLHVVRAVYEASPRLRMTLGGVEPVGPVRFDGRTYEDWQLDSGHVRWLPWRGHHLRSFRAGLWREARHAIHDRDATGTWIPSATDIALLLPMLERCSGAEVHRFDRPMYRYHMARSDNAGFHNRWSSRLVQIRSEAQARATPMFPVTLAWWYLPRRVKRALEPLARAVLRGT